MPARSKVMPSSEAVRLLFLVGLLVLGLPECLLSQNQLANSAQNGGVTLVEFRQRIAKSTDALKTKPAALQSAVDYQAADEAFAQILLTQARVSAARQSLDRLAGWNKAIKPRIENQSIAAIDVEILALAEKKAASEVARQEAALRRAAATANDILAREASSPLVAIVDAPAADSSDGQGLNTMEKEVLTRSRDLLAKLFQSYSVGGVEVTELLWYEREAAEAESAYRLWAARAGFDAAKRAAERAH